MQVNTTQAARLELETRQQSASELWHSARKLRLTASSAKKVPSKASTNPDKFLAEHLYPSFRGNYATNYGKENEVVACNTLKEQGMSIIHRGLVVSVQEPWLSASPDGVIDSSVLLEIKCPVPNKLYSTLLDRLTQNGSDVKLIDGVPQLQKTGARGYYMQVQLGMFCTGLRMAKLFIWSPNDTLSFSVPFDEFYVQERVAHLKRFYFTTMLPQLVDEFVGQRLSLHSAYANIMNS